MRYLSRARRPIIAAALASALLLAACGRAPDPEHSQDTVLDGTAPPVESVSDRPVSPRTAVIAAPAVLLDGPEAYLCPDDDRRCSGDAFMAATPAEAEWLMRNGYPSPGERERLQALSVDQLEAEAPDSEAAVLELAKRYSDAGDPYHAISLAFPLARSGNLFAYYTLADIHAAKRPRPDPLEGAAYLRLAYILGDYRASDVLGERLSRYGPVEHLMVDRRAARLYQTLAGSRAPDPRPFDEGD